MNNDEFYRAIYSTSTQSRFSACSELVDLEVGGRLTHDGIASALCDGAGGCEQLTYGDPALSDCWTLVSLMSDTRDGTYFVKIDVAGNQVSSVLFAWQIANSRVPNDAMSEYVRVLADDDWGSANDFGY